MRKPSDKGRARALLTRHEMTGREGRWANACAGAIIEESLSSNQVALLLKERRVPHSDSGVLSCMMKGTSKKGPLDLQKLPGSMQEPGLREKNSRRRNEISVNEVPTMYM